MMKKFIAFIIFFVSLSSVKAQSVITEEKSSDWVKVGSAKPPVRPVSRNTTRTPVSRPRQQKTAVVQRTNVPDNIPVGPAPNSFEKINEQVGRFRKG